jgi:hypothetical protein
MALSETKAQNGLSMKPRENGYVPQQEPQLVGLTAKPASLRWMLPLAA